MDQVSKARIAYMRLRNTKILKDMKFTSLEAMEKGDLFEVLIATILSQNTTDKNSISAYKNLRKKMDLKPEVLASITLREIEKSIKKAGLYKSKAKAIKESAVVILNKLNGNINNLRRYSFEEARKILVNIPGVGLKTADIILLHLGYPSFPVDTHIKRVSKRLGIVNEKAGYEEISEVWRKALNKEEYLDGHLRIIAFGRRICTAKRPQCDICPLIDICLYGKKYGESG